ncbi:hypothetical protein RRG08_023641 [Elysia crispata]|uniref:Uncharacterized protein n=1 Tax=Elysia crispata TaxID=231223 RepID=A0AAE0XSK0_9GAST|nr:hypothetical protein RRG08_023641 [Elysia crispata]
MGSTGKVTLPESLASSAYLSITSLPAALIPLISSSSSSVNIVWITKISSSCSLTARASRFYVKIAWPSQCRPGTKGLGAVAGWRDLLALIG